MLYSFSYYSEIDCLSPDFENKCNRPVPEITEKNETSFIITWNTTSVDSNCHSVVASTPPLIYTVYVNISGDDSIPGFPKVCVYMCVYMCVCVCERDRQTDRDRES